MITKKNKDFCLEYLANGYNGGQAYKTVYQLDNMDNCYTNASKLLKKQEIKDYIRELQHDRFEALSINADSIASELASIAFACKGDETYMTGYKLKALELLQKQMGLQLSKVEADVKETVITVSIDGDDDE